MAGFVGLSNTRVLKKLDKSRVLGKFLLLSQKDFLYIYIYKFFFYIFNFLREKIGILCHIFMMLSTFFLLLIISYAYIPFFVTNSISINIKKNVFLFNSLNRKYLNKNVIVSIRILKYILHKSQ